jgi:hypothetical protein
MMVATGRFPQCQHAIAYSLLVHSSKSELVTEESLAGDTSVAGTDHFFAAGVYANQSVELGLFSFTCLQLATMYDSQGLELHKNGALKEMKALWSAYDKYHFETGEQRANQRTFAKCDFLPLKRSFLKRCGSECMHRRKPLYCGRKCQVAVSHPTSLTFDVGFKLMFEDWAYHKQFCKPPLEN